MLGAKLNPEQEAMIKKHVEAVLATHFKSKYKVLEVLGKGGYSVVHNCVRRSDGSYHAAKVIDKQKLSRNALSSLKEEIRTMRALAHPRLISLREVYDHGATIYLVLEKVEGGELFDEIVRLHKYSELIAAEILFNFLDGLNYMHEKGYVHRDIKPENILLLQKPTGPTDICSELKIADFGFAAFVGDGEPLTTCCGTPRYISPEVLNTGLFQKQKGYGKTCDIWATGVIAYILLFGKAPFYHKDRNQLWHHITGGIWSMPAEAHLLSKDAVNFIENMIVVDRHSRLTSRQAIEHPFIRDRHKKAKTPRPLDAVLHNLAEFNAREKFKGAIFGLQSLSRVTYIKRCLDLGVKANTGLIKSMDKGEFCDDTRDLDLSTNYIGAKGLCVVLETVGESCPNLQSINMNASSVNNSVITALVDMAAKHPKLHSIHLDNNPLSYKAGMMLLQLAKTNPRIHYISTENTKVQEGIQRQLHDRLELNRSGRMKDYFRGSKQNLIAGDNRSTDAPSPPPEAPADATGEGAGEASSSPTAGATTTGATTDATAGARAGRKVSTAAATARAPALPAAAAKRPGHAPAAAPAARAGSKSKENPLPALPIAATPPRAAAVANGHSLASIEEVPSPPPMD
ncbi:Calcium/calmodulin-dependent protein kinase type II [Diplonema papillatum]|nr:Calcium/calmodulin-dependent protein kinase type II [Diplonema papillatum]